MREATKTHGLLNPLTFQSLALNPLTITGYIAILWASWKLLKLKQDQGEVLRASNERHEFFSGN
ncbi:MAG: hypothetical protein O9262_01880, partial [Cyclobacteriaceae bacterium]|nr:hypothetical protein [Cyclobacteriaceae bacterium]